MTSERAGAAIPAAMQLAQGHFVSQALYAALWLGLPDAIEEMALTAPEIATAYVRGMERWKKTTSCVCYGC